MSYTNLDQSFIGGEISLTPSTRIPSLFTPTAAQEYKLGTVLREHGGWGRAWRYCKNGATALTKAFMNCSEPIVAAQLQKVQTAYGVSVGEVKFDILCTTANAIANDELIDGILWVNATGSAEGDYYIIKDNYWITSDTVMMVEIADEGGVRTAIAATDDLSFTKHFCRDVKVNPTTQDAMVVGVNNVAVTANYYFWAQYRGACAIGTDASDTIVAGEPCGKAGTAGTAGAVGLVANDGTDAVWGTVIAAITGGEAALVQLMLP
jgi:hypothetical protein